jgi:hypothetical protein
MGNAKSFSPNSSSPASTARPKDGVIYSRRMVGDKAKFDKDRENGKGGGNPSLLDSVNGG